MPQDAGPFALSLIICNAIERERPEQPATYAGVTNMIQVNGQPGKHGGTLSPAPRMRVEARFAAGLARGVYRFGLRLQVGSSGQRMLSSREVRLIDSRQEVRLAHGWELKRVPNGPIWFEALIDDIVVMRVPFMVEVVSPSPNVPQA